MSALQNGASRERRLTIARYQLRRISHAAFELPASSSPMIVDEHVQAGRGVVFKISFAPSMHRTDWAAHFQLEVPPVARRGDSNWATDAMQVTHELIDARHQSRLGKQLVQNLLPPAKSESEL
eukprot:364726-Chlamydomonas_euryale.AAC.2